MTRIAPTSRADLAHYFSPYRRDDARADEGNSARRASTDDSRTYGNRRMGDRRAGDRRHAGRRASDRHHRQEASSWYSTQLGAHLIGQWIAPVQANANAAVEKYTAVSKANPKKGELA